MAKINLDHPTLPLLKLKFPNKKLIATEFRGETTLFVHKDDLHEIMTFLKEDADCDYNMLSDVTGVDYLNYPESDRPAGRFGVVYNLNSYRYGYRLFIKVMLDPSLPTEGVENDPALHLDSVTDLWPGAEWMERECYDMFGIHFDGNPDHRRILMWENYPAHPLRKDYPVIGRGEREHYTIVDRDSA